MPVFNYKAYDANGVRVTGTQDAKDYDSAALQLESSGLHVIELKARVSNASLSLTPNRITMADLEFVTSEISLLLRSGVKIDRSLQILAKGRSGTALGKVLDALSLDIKRGEPLSDALEKHKLFDSLYINLVKIGEASGQLSQIFQGLSQDLKFKTELRNKIVQSLTYPMVILFVCILSILFVFNFIVPQMGGLFDNAKNIPFYTQALLDMSAWMQNYQWYLFAGIGALIGYLIWLKNNSRYSGTFDAWLVRLPVVSSAITQIERIRFCTSLALMLKSGVKLDRAITLAADTIKNGVIKNAVKAVKGKISSGGKLTDALAATPIFPEFLLSLVEVGEESNQLVTVFDEIASRSRDEFSRWTSKVTSLLEPLMILFMGGIVGSVVVVMLLSIMSVNEGF